MHILLALAAIIGIIGFLFWLRQRQRYPALPAPLSAFEREVSADEFAQMVMETSRETPVLVDFYARWCGPCHRFAPTLAELARDYNGAFLLARIDYDKSTDLIRQYKVECVPTVMLFRGGEKIDGFEGGQLAHQVRYFLAKNGIKAP
jgi:putative thioredoxin